MILRSLRPLLVSVVLLLQVALLVHLPACASSGSGSGTDDGPGEANANESADNLSPDAGPATPYNDPEWLRLVELITAERYVEGLPLARTFADRFPMNEWARNNHGLCLLQTGRPARARDEFAQADAINPQNIAVVTNLAFTAARLDEVDDVIHYTLRRKRLLEQGAVGPGSEARFSEILQLELAEAHRRRGEEAAAVEAYEAGMISWPTNWWFPEFLSLLYTLQEPERWLELKELSEQLSARRDRTSHFNWRLPVTQPAWILQGHHGPVSHRGAIDAWAWDFQPATRTDDVWSVLHPDTDGSANEHYVGWGAEVVAAADGVVVATIDLYEDNPIDDRSSFTYGNGVVVRHERRGVGEMIVELSLYWHLRHRSLRVKPGDKVSAGDVLGTIGNSGVSLMPHLHFVVRRGPSLGVGLDARFHNYSTEQRGDDGDADSTAGVPCEGDVVSPD